MEKHMSRFAILLALIFAIVLAAWPQDSHSGVHQTMMEPQWSALVGNMETMHAAMASIEPSGNSTWILSG